MSKELHTSVLFVRLTPTQHIRLKEMAAGSSLSVNDYVRIKLGLQKRPPPKKKQDAETESDEVRSVSDDADAAAFYAGPRSEQEAALPDVLRDGDAGDQPVPSSPL